MTVRRVRLACDMLTRSFPCDALDFEFSKFKWPIRTVDLVLHINMCLETKFYIFWNFFTISLDLLKIAVFYGPDLLKTAIFNKSKKIVKKFQKM